jgi:RNA polymerase primary sigma factor
MAFEQEHEREPSTEELAELLEMSETEINKRIKATTYKTPWAFTKIGKHIFI